MRKQQEEKSFNMLIFSQVRELDLPMKRSQVIVARTFNEIREDSRYWCSDLLSEGKRSLRKNILTTAVRTGWLMANECMRAS